MRVKTLTSINTPSGIVPPGAIITIPHSVYEKLAGMVETMPSETVAKCRITGEECRIQYGPKLFKQYGHRNGDRITTEDGRTVTLRITEAAS